MFERVISQTIQRISNEVLRERSLISLADILDEERIPARLKPFFAAEVRWWLYNESLARSANRRFDYEQPELASLLNYLEQVQFKYARFERDEFLTVLDSAVKLTYNYLCRPQTTLKWYIFRGQPVRPLMEVMVRFDALSDYEYFRNVFIDWVESKQNERTTFDAISATEFERIIRRTDDQILLNCTVEDLLSIMSPLFEFIGEGEMQRVPLDALIIFFDDKNIKRLVDHLERHRDRGHEFTTREEFVSILDDLLSVADEEPEADFSQVYQNDELDDVVRRHLGTGTEADYDSDADRYAPMTPPAAPPAASSQTLTPPSAAPSTVSSSVPPATPPSTSSANGLNGEYRSPASAGPMSATEHRADSTSTPSASPGPVDHSRAPLEPVGPPVIDAVVEGEEGDESESVDVPHREQSSEDAPAAPGPELHQEIWHEETGDQSRHHGLPVIPPLMEEAVAIEAPSQEAPSQEAPQQEAAPPSPVPPSKPDPLSSEPIVREAMAPGTKAPEAGTQDQSPTDFEPWPEQRQAPQPPAAPQAPASQPGPDASQFGDVRRYIDSSLERKVIKKIFGRNRSEYELAVQKLNGADNWRAASQILDELFIRFGVDPYSRTAVRFTDSVYGRYLSRGE